MNVLEFKERKKASKKISMVTCYDAWSAKIIDESDVDCVLVGDSVAMVVHGFPSTLHATVEMMALHTAAVARTLSQKHLVADLPFPSFRRGIDFAMQSVDSLMKAGAQSVKIEGVWGHEDVISHVVESGVPVMGHLGLTPQSIHRFGGFKVQGRGDEASKDLLAQAKRLEDLGAYSVVLECIPSALASDLTAALNIPTIGIGAGTEVDGQVLVLQDLLGLSGDFRPKFLKRFIEGKVSFLEALNRFHEEVGSEKYPSLNESYL